MIAVQSQMHEKFGADANDLADGDSGVEGRGVRRRKFDADEVRHARVQTNATHNL